MLCLCLLLALPAFDGAAMTRAPAEPYVVSSIRPLQLLVTALVGDVMPSRVLLPAGVDVHHYAPRPSDVRQLQEAAAVFWIGAELEGGIADLLRQRTDAVALLSALSSPPADPHIWTSPALVAELVPHIVQRLSEVAPAAVPTLRSNAAALLSELSIIDTKYAKLFAGARLGRGLVLHDAYAPLVSHYNLQNMASITGADSHLAGTRQMSELREALKNGEFDCVFRDVGEAQEAGMRALLDNVEIELVELDPMGTTVDNHRDGFLRYFEQLVAAFAACRQDGA